MIFFSLKFNDSPITEKEELNGFMEGGEEVTDGGCDRYQVHKFFGESLNIDI